VYVCVCVWVYGVCVCVVIPKVIVRLNKVNLLVFIIESVSFVVGAE